MHVILLLLKILGIVLLAVLGLILLLICLVLFVPIRYSVAGAIDKSVDYKISGKVCWLFSILRFKFSYERGQEPFYEFRIFGIPKKPGTKKKPFSEEELEEELEKELENEPEEAEVCETSENQQDPETEPVKDTKIQKDVLKNSIKEVEVPQAEKAKEQAEQESVRQKKRPEKIVEKVRTFFVHLKKSIQNLWNGMKNAKDKIADIKAMLMDETNKKIIGKCFSEIKYLFRHFKFRKIRTDLDFSTGDPAMTGQVLGVLCLIPAMFRYQISIRPDFTAESPYAEGTFDVSGRIRPVHFLVTVIRLLKDKDVRNLIKRQIIDKG